MFLRALSTTSPLLRYAPQATLRSMDDELNESERGTGADEGVASPPAPAGVVLPLVAIVGRPNVGKSTLFNRLVGERRSIVGDEPGITRDRIYGETEWAGRRFSLVDTGGIVPDDAEAAACPLRLAVDAVALVWVVDARAGATPLDEELARLLRSTGKRVLVAANKVDAAKLEALAGEFHRFGFEDVLPISAENSDGVAELLDALVERFPVQEASGEDEGADERAREV